MNISNIFYNIKSIIKIKTVFHVRPVIKNKVKLQNILDENH